MATDRAQEEYKSAERDTHVDPSDSQTCWVAEASYRFHWQGHCCMAGKHLSGQTPDSASDL